MTLLVKNIVDSLLLNDQCHTSAASCARDVMPALAVATSGVPCSYSRRPAPCADKGHKATQSDAQLAVARFFVADILSIKSVFLEPSD